VYKVYIYIKEKKKLKGFLLFSNSFYLVSTKIGDAATQYRIPASGNCHVGHAVSEFGFEAPTGAI
jgi:hypothetical protein